MSYGMFNSIPVLYPLLINASSTHTHTHCDNQKCLQNCQMSLRQGVGEEQKIPSSELLYKKINFGQHVP